MNSYVRAFEDYSKSYPVLENGEAVESLIKLLYRYYGEENLRETPHTRQLWRQISEKTEFIDDDIFRLICQLCVVKEEIAFREGFTAGGRILCEILMRQGGECEAAANG